MKLKIKVISVARVFLSILLLLSSVGQATESPFTQLKLGTEDYAPMNYFENGRFKGISIDLLTLIWKREGISSAPQVVLYPWARGYYNVQNQPDFLLFAVARIPVREKLFHWACPIVNTEYILLAKKSANIHIRSRNDITKYTIGTIRSDVSEQILLSVLTHSVNILSNTTMLPNLDMMDKNRVQLVAYDKLGARNMLLNAGRNPEDFVNVFTVAKSETCFAFNKDTDIKIVNRFQEHLDSLVANGSHQKILSKYYENQILVHE